MALSPEQQVQLQPYFTSTDSDVRVFGLKNLPEVIKGTLFSRYSRTQKRLRELFHDEFFTNEDLHFETPNMDVRGVNVEKAENFYERVLVGYGDDSVAELGGAHVALENISMLATKSIEEHRIGLSPLEKSTRYVYYDQKINDEYLYFRDPTLMNSEHRDLFVETNELLFSTYSKIVRDIQPKLMEIFPGDKKEAAYRSSIRAKACDIARSLLPLSALTNMGVYGNGRAYEYLLTTMLHDDLVEVKDLGGELAGVLGELIPAFTKRATNERGDAYREYLSKTGEPLRRLKGAYSEDIPEYSAMQVRMVDFDSNAVEKIVSALLYTHTNLEYADAQHEATLLSDEEKTALIEQLGAHRKNRHHKLVRETEEPNFGFEIIADWGVYKDLMRHRMCTRHKKMFTSEMGYQVPSEISLTGFENEYRRVMDQARGAFTEISHTHPYEAQYLVTHGSFTNFYMNLNLRSLTHLVELRSTAQGHPGYRAVAQEMSRAVTEKFPVIGEHLLKFVDYNDYDLERLAAFRKLENKASKLGVQAFEE